MTLVPNVSMLRTAKKMAENQDWLAVLGITDESSLMWSEPRLLRWRLLAAAELKNNDIVQEVAGISMLAELSPMEGFAIVRELVQAGYYSEAQKILLGKQGLSDSPHFQRSASRLLKVTKIRDDRITLRRAIDAASNGGSRIRPSASSYGFRDPSDDVERALGRVSIDRSSVTDADHVVRLTADRNRFIRQVINRKPAKVTEYHDVFVNRLGQIWTPSGAVIVQRGAALPTTDISDVPVVDVAFNALAGTRGIYHWLVDRVPLLAGLQAGGLMDPTIPILLADNAPSFEADTLDLLGIDPDRVVRVADATFVRRLVVGVGGMSSLVDWSVFEPVLGTLRSNAIKIAADHGIEFSDRIYISRSAARRRPMLNEAAIEDAARERGFTVLHFEHLPLWHQLAIVRNAKIIMAPHGAGLAHLLIAQSGAKVIEILPIRRGDGTYFLRWNYARISLVRGHTYAAWLEEQPLGRDQWETRLDEFLPFLDKQLGAHSVQ